MSPYPLQLPDLSAPPATSGEDSHMLNGLATEDLPLTVDVPPIALMDDDKIVRHPGDGTDVAWKFVGLRRDQDGHHVIDYTADGEADSFTVTDPETRFKVEVGQVAR